MGIELIPVIEIVYSNQGVTAPDKYPYWENPDVWDKYNEESYVKAGFKDRLTPYLKGSSFYRLSDITDSNLIKLIIDHTQRVRDGEFPREQACTFWGGYVLRVDGSDVYFPQCCGELSDITYWERISDGQSSYYEGHPSPLINFDDTTITFDFSVDEFDEPFQPTPAEIKLIIDRFQLKMAVKRVQTELKDFEQRLNKINIDENLSIENIGGLLIWDSANY